MDGFVRHRIEGVPVDIEIVPASPGKFTARFRISGVEPDGHVVHVAHGPFATALQAEEAAKSAALAHILSQGSHER